MTKARDEFNNLEEEEIEEHYNTRMVNLLDEYLLDRSEILELGSGTAADLLKLSKNYEVTGSDSSKTVINSIQEEHPELELKKLNLHELAIKGTYDCIYSDKVLSELSKEEMIHALNNQVEHLHEDGIILMSLHYGEGQAEIDGQVIQRYTETSIGQIIPDSLRIVLIDSYSESAKKDSLVAILKKRTD